MSTVGKSVDTPSLHDSLPEVPKVLKFLQDIGSFSNYQKKSSEPLRIMFEQRSRKLSPQESFEVRLLYCIGRHDSPYYAYILYKSNVINGVAYNFTNDDWLCFNEKARAFVENDDRYVVHWRLACKYRVDMYRNTIIFMPKVPLPHMKE